MLKIWLRFWAVRVLHKYNPRIVAITGSTGKTTTKDAIYTILQNKDDLGRELVAKTQGNLNTEFGVPANIIDPNFSGSVKDKYGKVSLTLRDIWRISLRAVKLVLFRQFYPKILILELGLEKPGDIGYFMEFIIPEVGILTNIGDVHLEYFDNKADLVKEKQNLILKVKPSGLVVLNKDDQFSSMMTKNISAKKVLISRTGDADYKASDIGVSNSGLHFLASGSKGLVKISLPVYGQHFVYTALTALAVGDYFGMSYQEIANKLVDFKTAKARFERFDFNSFTLIDDTYNANPSSVKSALISLEKLGSQRRKVAILGDMKELGSAYYKGHQQVGILAAKTLDLLMVVGEGGKLIMDTAINSGLDESKAVELDIKKAKDVIFSYLRNNDIVLVKGSRVIGMDKIIDIIKHKFKYE